MQAESSCMDQVEKTGLTWEGKKVNMAVMKDLWETMGYIGLGLSNDNLRDQAHGLEKMQEKKREVIRKDIGCQSIKNKMDGSKNLQNNNSVIYKQKRIYIRKITSGAIYKKEICIRKT